MFIRVYSKSVIVIVAFGIPIQIQKFSSLFIAARSKKMLINKHNSFAQIGNKRYITVRSFFFQYIIIPLIHIIIATSVEIFLENPTRKTDNICVKIQNFDFNKS